MAPADRTAARLTTVCAGPELLDALARVRSPNCAPAQALSSARGYGKRYEVFTACRRTEVRGCHAVRAPARRTRQRSAVAPRAEPRVQRWGVRAKAGCASPAEGHAAGRTFSGAQGTSESRSRDSIVRYRPPCGFLHPIEQTERWAQQKLLVVRASRGRAAEVRCLHGQAPFPAPGPSAWAPRATRPTHRRWGRAGRCASRGRTGRGPSC